RNRNAKPPFVVAEIQDLRKLGVIQRAYSGRLEVIAGDVTIASLMAQNILHPGLSEVYNELLTDQDGNEFYVRSGEHFKGESLAAIAKLCPCAIICGLLRWENDSWRCMLNAPSAEIVQQQDKVIMMAAEFEHTEPAKVSGHRRNQVERHARP